MADGWIKLHRRIMESKTFSRLTAIQQLIAIYIILNANHEDGVWFDKYRNVEVPVKRGQCILSRNRIINEWFHGDKEITDRKVRTTLNKLNDDFLTIETTNYYTLVTVLNYDAYQTKNEANDQQTDQEPTKKRPANDQLTSLNKNDKNVKNDKKIIYTVDESEILSFWNSKGIIQHNETGPIKKEIAKALKTIGKEQIFKSITNYSTLLHDQDFFYSHKFALDKFLKQSNGLPNFLDDGQTWINYKEREKKNGYDRSKGISGTDAPRKPKIQAENKFTMQNL